ncbi:MAG: MerR family transcriptional regulator [Kofleriaceae bacterium]|nr:MerR family transcriptional regulator [Kofleriaceae bacterium]
MAEQWTLSDFVAIAAERIAALPAPKNGQVRAVPDERTVRYYGTLGLLDKPMLQGRTALYGPRQLAQVIAIKRLQSTGRSLAEIQALWPTLDDASLRRMSGVDVKGKVTAPARKEFWKQTAAPAPAPASAPVTAPVPAPAALPPLELRIALARNVGLVVTPSADGAFALTSADADAIRAAAAPLVAELARRQLTPHAGEEEP